MSDVYRDLTRDGLTANEWINRTDASRNAVFGYVLGRMTISGGDANAVECSLLHPQGFSALQDGALMWVTPEEDNTGPMTVDIEGIGAVPLRDRSGVEFSGGELVAGRSELIGYKAGDTPELRVLTPSFEAGDSLQSWVFTSSGVWNRPSQGTFGKVMLWGAGGPGGNSGSDSNCGGGGGGGSYKELFLPLWMMPAVVPVTIGAGGIPHATGASGGVGSTGGISEFGDLMRAYAGTSGRSGTSGAQGSGGGGGGTASDASPNTASTTNTLGGFGGGLSSKGNSSNLEAPQWWGPLRDGGAGGGQQNALTDSFYPTAVNQNSAKPPGIWGGAGGGGGDNSTANTNNWKDGGDAMYGGGGGGGAANNATNIEGSGGKSAAGGKGGHGANPANAQPAQEGAQPGGGGGGGTVAGSAYDAKKGGDGMCIVIVW